MQPLHAEACANRRSSRSRHSTKPIPQTLNFDTLTSKGVEAHDDTAVRSHKRRVCRGTQLGSGRRRMQQRPLDAKPRLHSVWRLFEELGLPQRNLERNTQRHRLRQSAKFCVQTIDGSPWARHGDRLRPRWPSYRCRWARPRRHDRAALRHEDRRHENIRTREEVRLP